jgi:hypothetical protein
LPDDESSSIMGRAIPPEWTVNLLSLVKEPWRFKDLEDQLNMYRQQWQAYQKKQIIAKMARKMPGKSNDEKIKNNERNNHNNNGGRSGGHQRNNGRGGRGRGRGVHGGRGSNNSEYLKTIKCLNCGEKGHYSIDCSEPRNKSISIFVERHVDQEGKTDQEVNDESLDMNVFEKSWKVSTKKL